MPSGQKFLLVGNLFFRPDVPPQLIAEKIGAVRVVGVLIACQGVYGALLGKMQLINGASVILPDDVGPLARDTGETWISRDYLFDLPDGTTLYQSRQDANLRGCVAGPASAAPEDRRLLQRGGNQRACVSSGDASGALPGQSRQIRVRLTGWRSAAFQPVLRRPAEMPLMVAASA